MCKKLTRMHLIMDPEKSILSKDRQKREGIDWPFDMQEIEPEAPNYGSRKNLFCLKTEENQKDILVL